MLQNLQQRRGWAGFWLLIGLILGGAAGAGAYFFVMRDKVGGGIPGGQRLGQADELALVPTHALGFVHIRARDLWKSDMFKDYRDVFEKAGPSALEAFDNGFAPAPSTLDHVTVVFVVGRNATPTPPGPIPKQPGQQPGKQPKLAPRPNPIPGQEESKSLIDFPEHVEVVGIFTFTADYDEAKVRSALVPGAFGKEVAGKSYWEDTANGVAAYLPGNKTIVVGTPTGVSEFLAKQKTEGQTEGPLAAPLELAAKGGRHVVAAINAQHFHVNLKQIRNQLSDIPGGDIDLNQIANDAEPLLHSQAFAVGVAFKEREDTKVDIHAYYKDEAKAEAAEKALRSLAETAHKKLQDPKNSFEKELKDGSNPGKPRSVRDLPEAVLSLAKIGFINKVDGYLTNPPLERNDKEVVATFELPSIAAAYLGASTAAVGMLIPAMGKVREAAGRASSSNNLKQIALAMLNYEGAYGIFPQSSPHSLAKGHLSWRVHILPFVEEQQLYNQFNLDEDWDSPTNKKLIEQIPRIYLSPLAVAPPGQTYYKVFSGDGAMFGPGKKTKITDITDGTSLTILAVEGGAPVIWTKPDDIPFDLKKPLPNLSLAGNRNINIVMVDGSTRTINLDRTSEKTLKGAITIAGGEVPGADW